MPRQRSTKQRRAIDAVLGNMTRPLSPQEILEQAKIEVPAIGMATVYRALNDLVEEGVLKTVDVAGQPPRYESAHLGHHHHFHCTRCDKVFELEGCLLKQDLQLPEGFFMEHHEITLNGHCPDCKD